MKWLWLMFLPALAFAKVKTEKVIYEKNGIRMEGLIAYNDQNRKIRPGVLVFHDWMGMVLTRKCGQKN